jgi:glycosyltransferase involved in cell wall biosynthesis
VPRISICIPSYNSVRFLAEAIESALAQDYPDLEVVVCDNASTDGTPELCARYSDARLRVCRFEELVGQAANWNRCLELARGELVLLLHADDVLRRTFVSEAVHVLDANPAAAMVHCTAEHVDAEGGHLHLQRVWRQSGVYPGRDLARRLLLEGCIVNPAGVLVRKSAYAAVGPFTDAVVWGVDWHMWTRLALHGDVAYLAEPLALYREHGQSGTSGVMTSARNGSDELWMMNDLFRRIPPAHRELSSLHGEAMRGIAHRTWCFAEQMCREGFPRAARAQLRRAVQLRPSLLLDRRVPTLWLATYLGYHWFERAHQLRRRLSGTAAGNS